MSNYYLISLCSNIVYINLFLSILILLISFIIFIFYSYSSKQQLIKDYSIVNTIKLLLIGELVIFFILNIILFYLYSTFLKTSNFFILNDNNNFSVFFYSLPINIFNLSINIDVIGLIFSNLAFFVGFISLLALDTRFYWNNVKFIFVCNFLVIIILVYTLTNNYFIFFLMYELLLIPSFLFVYYISPGKQSIQASLYFIIWTQVGSFLVLIAVAYLLSLLGTTSFNGIRNFNFTWLESNILLYLLFFGFGFKVPIWPFHYWITKTHVEAPTGFSIFLSGFLVKSAIYGFYKFSTLIGSPVDTTLFTAFCIMGVVDASLKMWGQTDLKKLVAYATIQEMGIIYLVFCWGDILFIYGGVLFCITHAFLSSIFFFFVDCVNRRYNSRNIVEVNGILHITPNLGTLILFGCVLYSGLPGTMKFISELYIFTGLFEAAPLSALITIIIANFLGIIGFSKVWYNLVFGLTPLKSSTLPKDLSYKELYIIFICFLGLVFYGIWVPVLF